MKPLTIYWSTRDQNLIDSICQRFGFPHGMSINGETKVSVLEADIPALRKLAERAIFKSGTNLNTLLFMYRITKTTCVCKDGSYEISRKVVKVKNLDVYRISIKKPHHLRINFVFEEFEDVAD